MEFNTVAISDGITMGTEGMKASLVSREIVADSIELVARGYMFDAVVALVGCDKTIPGAAMGLIRLDIPSLVLYGGSIAPGRHKGKDVTIQDVFEAVGANAAGRMTDAELLEIENVACPGAGACGGQYTANTMATVLEFIGLSPFGSSSVPATDPRKDKVSFECGKLIMDILRRGTRPSDVLTPKAFETLRALAKELLKQVDEYVQTNRISFEPVRNELALQALHANLWKSTKPRDRQKRVELIRTLATQVLLEDGWVLFHFDGDRP